MEEVEKQIELVSNQITYIEATLANPINAWNELDDLTKKSFTKPSAWWLNTQAALQSRLASLESRLATLESRLASLQQERTFLQQERTSLQQEKTALAERQNLVLQQKTALQQEKTALAERQNLVLQQQQSPNQDFLTLDEYLSKSIPPEPVYENNPPGPSSTKVKKRRTPSLISWDNFIAQVENWLPTVRFEYPDKNLVPPIWMKREISQEVSSLHPFISDNILIPVVMPFKHLEAKLYFGGSAQCQPDFIFFKNGKLLSVGEVKGIWTLPSESDLVAKYESNGFVKNAVHQLYSYLLLNHRNSGVLTNYEMTWFFERRIGENREEKVYVSPGIGFNEKSPTLFQCLAYFLNVIAQDNELGSPAPSRRSSPKISQKSTEKSFESPLEQNLSADDIDTGKVIGSGRTGTVFFADSEHTALKTLDISKSPHLVDEFIKEISIYWKLQPLQGKVIPNFRYCGLVEGILLIFGMDYVGKVPKKLNNDQKEKLISGLSKIHSYGILHGDIRVENIVVDSLGNPYLIDFTLSSFESNAEKQKEELSLLQNLVHSL